MSYTHILICPFRGARFILFQLLMQTYPKTEILWNLSASKVQLKMPDIQEIYSDTHVGYTDFKGECFFQHDIQRDTYGTLS